METISHLLTRYTQLPDTDTARLDCELLLANALGKERSYLYTWPEKTLTAEQLNTFEKNFSRRVAGEPLAYIVGEQEFWSLPLLVNRSTLIPRPETELLVEITLSLFADDPQQQQRSVLDLGTGTGAVALALASERPQWQLLGLEKQADAFHLAQQNGKRLGINNAHFRQSDWYSALDANDRFDFILSNPPYIDEEDQHLQQGDVRFEPRSALVAANKGLSDIQQIINGASSHLKTGAYLALEHGYQQANDVCALLRQAGFIDVTTHRDYAGQPRVSMGNYLPING